MCVLNGADICAMISYVWTYSLILVSLKYEQEHIFY